jgi:hypothetical protein
MCASIPRGAGRWAVLAALVVVVATGCGGTAVTSSTESSSVSTTATTTVSTPQLRILNTGTVDVTDLVVLFPDATVKFGSVAAGQTTDYVEVASGVYRYAAYRYTLDGQDVLQHVVDWVGEKPIPGAKFTYQIAFDPAKPINLQVTLLGIEVDEW